MGGCGGYGGFFGNDCTILFFIIIFLLLFYCGGIGYGACKDNA
ncbi:hypothetical protein DFR58_11561 [Anaerobacterium chartisolvens]|uniref:Uncharacterized protein n=1 Tax=Anaerobacterium chartisolvens TaxID=1297424 RepID=A0A369B190_9FIRM|nr:hypothetical protein [Anaerobacterium chartisolvens]RCX14338.1 hypothetical protein DFR58_11561 [Anaerobacterium chartisolvens]